MGGDIHIVRYLQIDNMRDILSVFPLVNQSNVNRFSVKLLANFLSIVVTRFDFQFCCFSNIRYLVCLNNKFVLTWVRNKPTITVR